MSESGEDPDSARMLAFAAGDAAAFEALFERWAGPLLGYLERIVTDAATAEELLQETFLRVHRARGRYEPRARFSTWLFRIATRLALNELRRPQRRRPHASRDAAPGAVESAPSLRAAGPGPDVLAHARRVSAEVEAKLAELPARQRVALWLVAVEGLSYAEVGEALGTSVASVKSLVHRARGRLADAVGSGEPAP